MYGNILKKDLKRKKTMNIILLIFIILSVMFVSSSVNNLLAVTMALDNYFDRAGVPDYYIVTKGASENNTGMGEILDSLECVNDYKTESCIYTNEDAIEHNGEKKHFGDMGLICSFDSRVTTYFDSNNNELTDIKEGEIYLRQGLLSDLELAIGDKITLTVSDVSVEFTIKGTIKDAVFGSEMMGTPRFVVNRADYDKFANMEQANAYAGMMYAISTDDVEAVAQAATNDLTALFVADKALLKMTYIFDMIISGIILIVSVFLIIIAFVILRFTITFTLSEEFREIGIMKAIGIKNSKIRGLYVVKYFAMAVVGSIVGFSLGIPFGNMLLAETNNNIVIDGAGGLWVNVVATLAVLLIIMLFCYGSTKKVKKMTPIDAIRSGQTGERYKKKGLLHLSKSKLRPVPFMAVNDILSGIKRFSIVAVTFMISILLVTIILNTMTTLQSEKLISWFSMTQSDVYLSRSSNELQRYISTDGHDRLKADFAEMKQALSDNGIEADMAIESMFKLNISKGDKSYKSLAFQGTGTTTDEYSYISGTAPQNTNEIALSYIVADKIGAEIGDTVKITTAEGTAEYIITALLQSMNNTGEGIRLHQDVELDYAQAMGFFAYQINYTDSLSSAQKAENFETIKKLYPEYQVYTGGEYVDYMVGGISENIRDLVGLILLVVIVINVLVAVLMEKSFFIKEKSEIAMLKAIGFTNRAIIIRQALRMSIVMISGAVLAILLADPIGQLTVGCVFKMMGACSIIFDPNILLNYIICPLIVVICTVISVILVNQQVRGVSTAEVNSIE